MLLQKDVSLLVFLENSKAARQVMDLQHDALSLVDSRGDTIECNKMNMSLQDGNRHNHLRKFSSATTNLLTDAKM